MDNRVRGRARSGLEVCANGVGQRGEADLLHCVERDTNDVGNLFREPVVIARMTVYDASALKVLDVRGVGTGATSLLFADRSPANLRLAFDDAMASLMSVSAAAL